MSVALGQGVKAEHLSVSPSAPHSVWLSTHLGASLWLSPKLVHPKRFCAAFYRKQLSIWKEKGFGVRCSYIQIIVGPIPKL